MKKASYQIKVIKHVDHSLCERLLNLQKEIWEIEDRDILPGWKIMTIPPTGNILIVAFHGRLPVAIAVLTRAFDREKNFSYLYLDMLGVKKEYANNSLAFRMISQAKRVAVQMGFKSIQWTFDPLRANNANLYIRKLGARAVRYYADYYRNMSGINRGIPADRLWTELLLNNNARKVRKPDAMLTVEKYRQIKTVLRHRPASIAIEIPSDFVAKKDKNIKHAISIRLSTRRVFQSIFKRGYLIDGFMRDGDRCFYIASKQEFT